MNGFLHAWEERSIWMNKEKKYENSVREKVETVRIKNSRFCIPLEIFYT